MTRQGSGGLRALVLLAMALLSTGCMTLSSAQHARASAIVEASRSTQLDCAAGSARRCAAASPLRALGDKALAESAPESPRHYVVILDEGNQALLARINLLRAARESIDLQTYIFDEDDAGRLVLDELMKAARRGVRVRVLIDQLSALEKIDTLAGLAGAHANFSLRVYNPVLGRARLSYPQYVLAAACCFRQLNRRMHSKLLLVDDDVGIVGGRNYQNDYYDWDPEFNFRDRDLVVAGPVAREMGANFDAFWESPRSRQVESLSDVGRRILRTGVPALPAAQYDIPQRAAATSRDADDAALVASELVTPALPIGRALFIADLPQKHRREPAAARAAAPSTPVLQGLIESARDEVLLQTPYLVLSRPAQKLFHDLQDRPSPPRVVVSTNSLASTDSFITYALAHKYKRRYLRDFGFEIHEYKPYPADAPVDLAATGADLRPSTAPLALRDRPPALGYWAWRGGDQNDQSFQREYTASRYLGRNVNAPVPLKRAGVRIGMHAKSMVIDQRIGVVGTHNFDPRGDRYNTENAIVIDDPTFAQALAASIRRDMAPGNSWVIARRDKLPVLSGLEYSLAKMSETLPIFDLWPVSYATSYEFTPGPQCPQPLRPADPRFRECHAPVGDFPEVAIGFRWLSTKIFTAFGAGLAPIL